MMKIEKSKYQGYLWYSKDKEPRVLDNEEFGLEIEDAENPFIVEGQLYDKMKRISYSIKFVDGEYITNEYKLDELKDVEYTEQVYYANRMGNKQLRFYQFWREEPDDCCEGMKVLQPKELVFVGFKD